jgi:L-amino acid N-acyltransferase YncA
MSVLQKEIILNPTSIWGSYFWTLNSGVFPENAATLKLHEKFGFRIIRFKEKVARLDGKWRNTILRERRSKCPNYI